MQDKRLLEHYVKEVISELEFKRGSFNRKFSSHIGIGDMIKGYLEKKILKLLGAEVADEMSPQASSKLSQKVQEWFEDHETIHDRRLDKRTKKEIVNYAATTYAKLLKNGNKEEDALRKIMSALDRKYDS
jgi:hypothetical protein